MDVVEIEKLRESLLSRLQASLTNDEREHAAVYLDSTLHTAGLLKLGSTDVAVDQLSHLLFIDSKAGANWMHPCRYLLIPSAAEDIRSVDTEQPPAFGPLPANWSLLWRAPSVEDWQLLPLSSISAT